MLSLARVQRSVASRAVATSLRLAAPSAAVPLCRTTPLIQLLHAAPAAGVRSFAAPASPALSLKAKQHAEWNNVTESVSSKIGRNLHLQPGHPLTIIKQRIAYYFDRLAQDAEKAAAAAPKSPTATKPEVFKFTLRDNVPPHVTVAQNFDSLLFPADHVGRSLSDTFYFDRTRLLRTHTTAHEVDFLREGLTNFLTVGDCYRRDEIDASHYPVFHQMEGVRVFAHDVEKFNRGPSGEALVVAELKQTLEGLVRFLFGSEVPIRWVEGNFPFTTPSFEMEVWYQERWLEVLGCGVLQHAILDSCSPPLEKGKVSAWAFGMGLERLAMVLFDIPDIRLFWSTDPRFLKQFSKVREDLHASGGKVTPMRFTPFSKYPACFKDVSFWVPKEEKLEPQGSSAGGEVKPHDPPAGRSDAPAASTTAASAAAPVAPAPSASAANGAAFHENDLCSLVRDVAGDLVENVHLQDSFVHPKTGQTSKCYRIMYRALDRNLTNEEIDVLQEQIRAQIPIKLGLTLR